MSEKTIGQVAFEAYNESKGGLTYDGKPIPPWDELSGDKAAVHRAWEAAAAHAYAAAASRMGVHSWLVGAECAAKLLPKSREASLVLTKIEEAQQWEVTRDGRQRFNEGRGRQR